MTGTNKALKFFLEILQYHQNEQQGGATYQMPPNLPAADIDKISKLATRHGVSAEVFTAAIRDLLLIKEGFTAGELQQTFGDRDIFGTYLKGIQNYTALEQILLLVQEKPQSLSELAKRLDFFSPKEIVAATAKAVQLGMVRLEKVADRTTVYPMHTIRK